jgi:hypothetical protein
MRVAVHSVVLFNVPDGLTEEQVRELFWESNRWAVGQTFTTVSGLPYVMIAIEKLEVKTQ